MKARLLFANIHHLINAKQAYKDYYGGIYKYFKDPQQWRQDITPSQRLYLMKIITKQDLKDLEERILQEDLKYEYPTNYKFYSEF